MKFNIENYETMTLEQKVAALEAWEPDMSGWVAKSVADKHASDAAEYKKKYRESLSAEEQRKQKEAEDKAELIRRVEELEAEKAIHTYTTAYMAMGYDEKLARATAKALGEGDMETVFANQKAHTAAREKALKAEILKGTPTPAAGAAATVKKEDFAKMSLAEKTKFAEDHPEIYKEFYGG